MSDYLTDYEWSWIQRRLNGFTIIPSVRNQGRRPSCVFQAFSASTDMETRRVEAIQNVPALSNQSVDTDSYIGDYEHLIGRRLGSDFARGRVWSAAHLMLHRGVAARVPGQPNRVVRLDNVQAHGKLRFHEVTAFIKQGKPVIGGFTCNKTLNYLPRGEIYSFRPSRRHPTIAHMVVFVGFGLRNDKAYLVFLNSDGEDFSEDGFGRIWLEEVRDFHTIRIAEQPFDVDPILTHEATDSYSGRHGVRSAATASRRHSYGGDSSASRTSVDATPCGDGDFEFIMGEHK